MRVAGLVRTLNQSEKIRKSWEGHAGARTGDRRRGGSVVVVVVVVARYEPIRRNRYIGYLKKPMSSTLYRTCIRNIGGRLRGIPTDR